MNPIASQLAAILASTDGVARIVRQSNALFLVSPSGEVWRIYDSDDAAGNSRYAPASNPFAQSRVFVGGVKGTVKVYAFRVDESRSIAEERLHEQLVAAVQPIAS